MGLPQDIQSARRAATPLLVIRTSDPAQTRQTIMQSTLNGTDPAILYWDSVKGLEPHNEAGQQAYLKIAQSLNVPAEAIAEVFKDPVEMLKGIAFAPKGAITIMVNAHRFTDDAKVAQAVWNLRDIYTSIKRTLIMLCPHIELPGELFHDVTVLDEALPDAEELAGIARRIHDSVNLPQPDEETMSRIVDATCGLSPFGASQICAMSIQKSGMNLRKLWDRKVAMIEQVPGLSVWRGDEIFDNLKGCDNVQGYLMRALNGRRRPRGIVWIDEGEKSFGGSAESDTSGVKTGMKGTFLSWMQDHRARGIIGIGVPGSGKSAIAKAAGNMAGVPTISFDLNGMQNSLVGESEARLRGALRVVDAITQGEAYFILTCNAIQALSPELRRRFNRGIFFFDLLRAKDRPLVWDIYLRKFGFGNERIPEDQGWTGAEIESCCETAYEQNISLIEAAQYVVPVAKSAAGKIKQLQDEADGCFLSACYPGVYRKPKVAVEPSIPQFGVRQIEVQ